MSMKIFLLTLLVFIFFEGSGQDSTNTSVRPGYKKWTKHRTVLRFGTGFQESGYLELGFSRHHFFYNDLGYASGAYYGSFEWTPLLNVYGLKGGYEINARAIALGLEAKFQNNTEATDFVITPKIGFGTMGVLNVFYGYNISFLRYPFEDLGKHQFSLVFNFNRLAYPWKLSIPNTGKD